MTSLWQILGQSDETGRLGWEVGDNHVWGRLNPAALTSACTCGLFSWVLSVSLCPVN